MATCKDCGMPTAPPNCISIAVDATNLGGTIQAFHVCEGCVDANLNFYGPWIEPPAPAPVNEYRAQAGTAEGVGTN